MSNLSKLEFVALDISGKNYLSWVLDAKIHLTAKGLGDCIIEGNKASSHDKAKAMIFLRHHLDESLKNNFPIEICGETIKDEDLLKKTLTTFHASNMILQQQYREKGFQKYSEMISCLLVTEQHNDLLMKNHEARPAGSALLPEAHGVEAHNQKGNKGGASSSNARVESYLTLKDDVQARSSQKYDESVEANLALKDDVFDGLNDITHLEAEDFFGDRN
ncbi:uncharacterized protein [Solanum tuberosum]|uniref:uncharacterized protein n=1 Tax=Solanum tuberosum TaxID=4113 RepID=UPI00073A366D|nr:PREDICTED: uncharacterized protein LOC107061430 [Solanum tuberosum]